MGKKALLIFIFAFVFLFSSCTYSNKSNTQQLLAELIAISGESMESGSFYISSAEEQEPGYMSDDTKKLLYGSRAQSSFEKIEEYTVFVSARGAGELALFKCFSASDTREIEKMCLERAEEIKVALRHTPYEDKSRKIQVCVSGKLVFMCLCDNARGAVEAFKRII